MILDLRLSREVRSARPPALTTRRRSRQQASLIYCLTSSHLGFHSSMLPLLSPCVFSSFLRSLHFSLRNSLSRVLVSMLLVRMHDMMTRHSSIHTTTTRSDSSCVRTQRRLIFIFFFLCESDCSAVRGTAWSHYLYVWYVHHWTLLP